MAFYICSNCGYGTSGWLGKCPDCNQFNTFVKQAEVKESKGSEPIQKLKLTSFSKIAPLKKNRMPTGVFEFDRVLGGGIVPGEVILLSGEPGVGKSTLLLQTMKNLKTIFISGEEAAEQVKERAERLKINLDNFMFSDDLQVEGIVKGIENIDFRIDVLVIDSIQTVYTKAIDAPPGNISQLRESVNKLVSLAKKTKTAVVVVGHITKGGDIAGPKTLEHLVDCVLTFEGERVSQFRVLRASKNRFGSTDEIGVFEMVQSGLKEITNPLAFLEEDANKVAGKAIIGAAEGKRPLFFEVQTLAVPSFLAVPRRVVNGLDYNKVILLIAVVRKHLYVSFDKSDLYVNVVGGVDVKSPSSDLGVVASLISSSKNVPLPPKTLFVGEVGLLGEVRKSYGDDRVLAEARRLKFTRILSFQNVKNIRDLKRLISL